ncbi:uncharacterized protein HMPREF1541_03712 [Cyphellophora europaea CBS 101466]|uniref:Fibronectin type-III domain-containing protein n=1 Tax=Cyphellophora europaea (strain CBS 101466) TaxID=1220924 RepID=W2RZK2_CYPE1|nr:uncharacterized protein HMPREF1541_03712 [Cyphellophora europaea CBS 101466]ETN41775.1 hypothetical protein HMPREF1541_03712 [Cyphellophora europaea CBS 101466]
MDSIAWQKDSLDWAHYAYAHLLAPRLEVKGRMAMFLLLAVIWASAWLLWRTYSVLTTPNDLLVDKLGLDIPPQPLVTLEEISATEVQIGWKPSETSTAIQEYQIEINGKVVDRCKRSETAAVISHLLPGRTYDIRVFSVSAGRFQTPSAPLHVRLPSSSTPPSEDGASETVPTIRAIAARAPSLLSAPSAPAMAREHSGGQPHGRRGTTGRRSSPAGTTAEKADAKDENENEDLAELSSRFASVREEIEAVEKQVQDEKSEYDGQLRELEAKKEKLRQDLKKRDEESSDLRKQVHKAESQNRALLNDKTKKERELKARENERRKKKDDVAKWEEQISTMAEEIAGIETQKAAIKRRNEANIREVEQKVEEERKEVAVLEEEAKEKTQAIKALEEERKELDVEDDTDETRETNRQEQEREAKWRGRFQELLSTHNRLYNDLQQATMYLSSTRDRLQYYESMRQNRAISFAAPPVPLNLEPQRQRSMRRPRHTGSHGSSVSSPRGPFVAEAFQQEGRFGPVQASPTTFGPSYFNPQNGMTLMLPTEAATTPGEEGEALNSVPMSPHADALLPADLLGDESGEDEDDKDAPMPTKPTVADAGKSRPSPFPNIGSPLVRDNAEPVESPSAGSSSRQSFASPRGEGFAAAPETEHKSTHSGKEKGGDGESPSNSRKFMYNLFNINRQRGKTLEDDPPMLGSLKPTQSQSFPRNFDDLDPSSQPRRRLSYGGNWAFPGNFLGREKDSESRFAAASRRAFPSLMGLGKSADVPNFTPRTNSFDPGTRGESPRPSSIYSFDKMPRPGAENALHVWNMDRSAMRNSPLAPDWGSMHSFSRSHSRRPSVGGYGSTTNLSMMGPDEEIVEPKRDPRPLQAPIGTRPASSQRKEVLTPKLNPAAPNFTSLFKKSKGEKVKIRDPKEQDKEDKRENDVAESTSPPDSRKSRDAPSLAPTLSTMESKESLDRTTSTASVPGVPSEGKIEKPTLMSRISRTASNKTYSSMKFGSWKEKSFLGSKSSKDTMPEIGDDELGANGSSDQLGRSIESRDSLVNDGDNGSAKGPSTPKEGKDKNRSSINWNFMRKSKEKGKDKRGEPAQSDVSVSGASVAGSEVPTDTEDDEGERRQ